MSEALINRLVEFAESGNQQKIVLSGISHQGWVMEISEEALLISSGFAEKTGQEQWLSFDDLARGELYYWDNQHDQWVEFKL